MPIRFTCSCGRELQANDEYAGRLTRCPDCSAELRIPNASTDVRERTARDDAPRRPQRRMASDYDEDRGAARRPMQQTSAKAIWALILGFLSFGFGFLTAIPSIILGLLSLRDIGRSEGRLTGKGMAVGGIIVSILAIPCFIGTGVGIGFGIFKVHESADQQISRNNLKQMALAAESYSFTMGHYPPVYYQEPGPANNFNPRGMGPPPGPGEKLTGLSWRVAILPYIEQDNLYRQFHRDEPWDSPHNKTLLTQMPKVYAHPNADPAKTAAGLTYYRSFTGPGAIFDPTVPQGIRMFDITDGTSNTILVVEAAEPVEWTKPDDLPFGPGVPLPKLGLTSSGFNVVMADASTRWIKQPISDRSLRAAITRNEGDIPGPDW
jgi:hypothetical protein